MTTEKTSYIEKGNYENSKAEMLYGIGFGMVGAGICIAVANSPDLQTPPAAGDPRHVPYLIGGGIALAGLSIVVAGMCADENLKSDYAVPPV